MQYYVSQNGETLTITDQLNGLKVLATALSDMGMVRPNNEDNVQVWTFESFVVAMVADGMGGAAGGEHASRLAVESVQAELIEAYGEVQNWENASEDELGEKMEYALRRANQSVLDKAAEDHLLHGMGTTTTLVILHGTRALFAHIGDSRAYLIDGLTQSITQISNDHTFVQALVASGHLTPEQAKTHPMGNVLYRALGQRPEAELEIDLYSSNIKVGDRLVLCSDGLPRHVHDDEIRRISLGSEDTAEIAHQLIDLAKERGGEDNVSTVVLLVETL